MCPILKAQGGLRAGHQERKERLESKTRQENVSNRIIKYSAKLLYMLQKKTSVAQKSITLSLKQGMTVQ